MSTFVFLIFITFFIYYFLFFTPSEKIDISKYLNNYSAISNYFMSRLKPNKFYKVRLPNECCHGFRTCVFKTQDDTKIVQYHSYGSTGAYGSGIKIDIIFHSASGFIFSNNDIFYRLKVNDSFLDDVNHFMLEEIEESEYLNFAKF